MSEGARAEDAESEDAHAEDAESEGARAEDAESESPAVSGLGSVKGEDLIFIARVGLWIIAGAPR